MFTPLLLSSSSSPYLLPSSFQPFAIFLTSFPLSLSQSSFQTSPFFLPSFLQPSTSPFFLFLLLLPLLFLLLPPPRPVSRPREKSPHALKEGQDTGGKFILLPLCGLGNWLPSAACPRINCRRAWGGDCTRGLFLCRNFLRIPAEGSSSSGMSGRLEVDGMSSTRPSRGAGREGGRGMRR